MKISQSIHLNQKLGEIISVFPESAEILNRYQIDYCCGGNATLAEALEAKAMDSESFVKELNIAYEDFADSNSAYMHQRNEKQLTYNLFHEIEKELFIHIYLENGMLFAKCTDDVANSKLIHSLKKA